MVAVEGGVCEYGGAIECKDVEGDEGEILRPEKSESTDDESGNSERVARQVMSARQIRRDQHAELRQWQHSSGTNEDEFEGRTGQSFGRALTLLSTVDHASTMQCLPRDTHIDLFNDFTNHQYQILNNNHASVRR